ncbi:hypothetical protein F0562_026064 [Nyssa sinensis]|uniref:BED-type domain-containing protein n=1 Tax=Nyssa sinensis TaxID=561372 RepID=A0A5J5BBX8_9ASTE|nr:hypothetical protein F0562_026064 [Nyssa sinensis]
MLRLDISDLINTIGAGNSRLFESSRPILKQVFLSSARFLISLHTSNKEIEFGDYYLKGRKYSQSVSQELSFENWSVYPLMAPRRELRKDGDGDGDGINPISRRSGGNFIYRLNILDFTSVLGDMSTRQPGFTSAEQDSCTPFSFEESSTSPLMEDIDKDGIDVGDISDHERNNGNDEGNNENMANEKNDTQNEDANPHKHAFQRKPRKRTSIIWNDFEEVVNTDGSKKVKCNYCLAKFNMPSTSATMQFHRHLKRCTQRQLASKKQMVLSVETVASDCTGSIANFKYDRAKIYPEAKANRNIATVKQALYDIYNERVQNEKSRLMWRLIYSSGYGFFSIG